MEKRLPDSYFESTLETEEIADFHTDDYTDVIYETQKKKRIIKWITTTILGILILVAGYFLYKTVFYEEPEEVATEQSIDFQQSEDYIKNTTQPLLEIYQDAPVVEPRQITTEVNKEKDSITAGKTVLKFSEEVKIDSIVNTCDVVQPTDFCLAATGVFEEEPMNIYFFNDAVHSRMFENPSEYQEVEIKGSPASVVLVLEVAGEKGVGVVTAGEDSSGFLITLPDSMGMKDVEKLSRQLSITQI